MTKKTAIIVGGSSEIGLATAKKLAKQGYDLALTYNTNKIDIKKEFAQEIEQNKTLKIKLYQLNLAVNGEIEKFFDKVSNDFAYIDSLVFASGVAQKRALIMDVSNEEIDKLFEVNIKSAIKCVRELVKLTVNHHPANIVLVGSFAEKVGCSCESVYTSTKSAMSGLCKSLSSELGNFDVRINVVAPGFIDTKMNGNLSQEEKDDLAEMTPLKRLGTANDVANAIAFLCGEEASFITGQTIYIDGGLILE